MIAFDVAGTPAPQGSKRHVGNGVMVESSAKVKPWRQDVKYAAIEMLRDLGRWPAFTGPVVVSVTFRLARPKSHHRTGRNSHLLSNSAPRHPGTRPDLDKLVRSTLDALGEAGVWHDDSQVVELNTRKTYCGDLGGPPGARIEVQAA